MCLYDCFCDRCRKTTDRQNKGTKQKLMGKITRHCQAFIKEASSKEAARFMKFKSSKGKFTPLPPPLQTTQNKGQLQVPQMQCGCCRCLPQHLPDTTLVTPEALLVEPVLEGASMVTGCVSHMPSARVMLRQASAATGAWPCNQHAINAQQNPGFKQQLQVVVVNRRQADACGSQQVVG